MPGPLGLPDDAFWDDPRRTEDAVHARLIDEGFLGVVLDAPARVPLARRETLPVAGVHVASLREAQGLDLRQAAVATAVRLETNELYAGPAFKVRAPATDSILDDSPVEDPPEGRTLSSFATDLRARLALPWRPSTLLLTLLARDLVTNRVTTKLEAGGGGGFRDPAVAAFKATHRRPRYPQPIWPPLARGQPLPTYRGRPDSPPVPEAPGIALLVERVTRETPDAEVVLRGSFRLPVLEREVVKPRDPADEADLEGKPDAARAQALREGAAWQDPGDPEATAVIPILIVATGAARPSPMLLRLQVPSYDPIDPTEEAPVVTGHFAVELLGQGGAYRLSGQTSFVYALSGQALAGPAVMALVDPQEVP